VIPVRLQVKNFMSYGEGVPPLELAGVRLACLSGDNGNGKSALLDAMTWALFGETRAASDDDVIRLGTSDCQVIFDFLIGSSEYRIHKARGKRGAAAWELQIRQEDGSTRSLSGASARETKSKIEHLLRMDYRTFLASGYFAQGRADEFARSTVAERKKVLADILDLSRYERLEQMAKDRRKEAEDRELDAERELRAIDAELAHEDSYHVAHDAARVRREAAAAETERGRALYEQVFADVQRLEEREGKAREYEGRIPEIEEEIAGNRRHAAEIGKRLAAAEGIVARRDVIEAAYARFLEVSAGIKPLEAQYDAAIALQREAQEIERRIRDAFDALDRERYRLEREVQTLETETREIERYDQEIRRFDDELALLGDLQVRRQNVETRRREAEDRLVELRTSAGTQNAQEAALLKRLAALANSSESSCEYCGQPLSPEKRRAAIDEAKTAHQSLIAEHQRTMAEGRNAKRGADDARAEAEQIQKDLQLSAQLGAQRAQATQERIRIVERTATLPDVRRRMAEFEQSIARREYAPADQERLIVVSAQLERLERIGQQIADARAEIARYAGAERERLQLQAADAVLQTEPARVRELTDGIERRETQIAKARKQIADIRAATASLPERRTAAASAAVALRAADDEARIAEREIGQFTALLTRCADLRKERLRRAEERMAAAREKDLYKELMGAFGKKGVQALIIENALPEIETQANELLSRMTDGGMQLRLRTQREAKSAGGASIETLDIIISDDMGTRPYEMFSGGEAFRINFALRIALARLLAHRAGAPLQTLILDEGFGTQDPRGREAIVDSINSISDSFALILVITHIEELKDAFPTRIEIVKGPLGSTFTVQ
jgi:exonuclease SbcC